MKSSTATRSSPSRRRAARSLSPVRPDKITLSSDYGYLTLVRSSSTTTTRLSKGSPPRRLDWLAANQPPGRPSLRAVLTPTQLSRILKRPHRRSIVRPFYSGSISVELRPNRISRVGSDRPTTRYRRQVDADTFRWIWPLLTNYTTSLDDQPAAQKEKRSRDRLLSSRCM